MKDDESMSAEELRELYGEPISVYTDAQAVEDGVLVDVRGLFPVAWKVNRATRALWDAYTRTIANGMMTDVTRFVSFIRIAWAAARTERGWRIAEPGKGGHVGPTVWFVPNEVDGYTAMFPEDY